MKQKLRSGRLLASILGLAAAFVTLCRPSQAQTVVYQWNPTNLYNQTHPSSGTNPYNWDTDWVARPGGGQSLRVTVPSTKPAGNWYEFIVVNPGTNLLQNGQECGSSDGTGYGKLHISGRSLLLISPSP